MKATSFILAAAGLVFGANLLRAQDSSAPQPGGPAVISAGQSAGAVVVQGGGPGGTQTFSFDGAGTNGFDAGELSKAIQAGMKQVFGNGGSNFFSGGSGGDWNPAKMMQRFNDRMLDNVRDGLGFTDDAEWAAVRPLVEKVVELQQQHDMAAQMSRSKRMFGGSNSLLKGFGVKGQESPEQDALQKAVDDNAPVAEVREAIAKLRAARKEEQGRLDAAQAGLRKVLTAKQEAQAILLGLLN